MANIKKTNALRILDRNNIKYKLLTYEVDENDLSGEKVARQIGKSNDELYKTLVLVCSDLTNIVACISVGSKIDLKKLALVAKQKSVEMVKTNDLLNLTGYIRGGVSPVGMKKKLDTYISSDIMQCDIVGFSAGMRGLQMLVKPKAIIELLNAHLCDITVPKIRKND